LWNKAYFSWACARIVSSATFAVELLSKHCRTAEKNVMYLLDTAAMDYCDRRLV
jgi:hypothetical protein